MERGERSTGVLVLIIVSVVAVLATGTLLKQPTGRVMQGKSIYVTEDFAEYAIECENRRQEAVFLGYNGAYKEYCCLEDYVMSANYCSQPMKILAIRTY